MKPEERTRLEAIALKQFEDALQHWIDLPDYISTPEYKDAFMKWIDLKIDQGQTDMQMLAVMTLHHETGGRLPYFEFSGRKPDLNSV